MKFLKFKQSHNFNWYIIAWGVALLFVIYLYSNWHIDKNYIGIVEKKAHPISAQEPGIVQNVFVTVGDDVKNGQVLAMLEISDLKTSLSQMSGELANIINLESSNKDRFALSIQQMGLQLENEVADLMHRLSMIESQSTELAGLNKEIKRLEEAEKAGLGHSPVLMDLKLRRDALASYLKEQSKDFEIQNQKLDKARETRKKLEEADIDSISKSLYLERMEHAEELKRQISETEYRIRKRSIIAPCDGYVTDIAGYPGDVVQEFLPIVTIEETKPLYLQVFIPEKSLLQPEKGMEVKVYCSRNKTNNTTGIVTFVHPGFTLASDRISFRGQIFWVRKVRVKLDVSHKLLPGEVVYARFKERKADRSKYFPNEANASMLNDKKKK